MTFRIDPEFKALIEPAPANERAALEAAIVRDGVREPLLTWRGLLVDGHTRYEIAARLGIKVASRELDPSPPDRAAVKAWIVDNQCTRRNLTAFQRTVLMARNGMQRPAALATPTDWDLVIRGLAAGHCDNPSVVSFLMLRNRLHPRPPRGATTTPHYIPEGHELAGASTLTGPDGEQRGQWSKTRVAGADPTPLPEGFGVPASISRLTRGDGSVVSEWQTYRPEERDRAQAWTDALARHVSLYAGLAGETTPAPIGTNADTITLYPLGDPHIGMLAWAPETGDHFDVRIACRELLGTVRALVAAAPASEHAIVCNLGEFMHAQDDANRTPGHGNVLDVDGRYGKVLDAGHVLLRGIVDAALEKHARVTVRNLPGNHDPRVSAELAMWLRATYESEWRVNIEDAFAAHQYDRFGACLFGWHHGDRTKAGELPAIMACDRGVEWGETTEHVWHVGHVHHLTRTETPGCVVETHRTMAARDAYHAGRYRAGRSLCAITYHKEFGEIARATVNLARVRAALKETK